MKIFLSAIIFFLCFACKKETGVAGPQGPPGNPGANGGSSADAGTISGKVSLYDEFGNQQDDFTGIVVKIVSGPLSMQDTTDASGQYHFDNLQTGTFDLTYEKSGYGTYKIFGVSHVPSGQLPTKIGNVYMIAQPVKTAVNSINIQAGYYYSVLYIKLDTSSLTYQRYYQNFMILVGKDANVNPTNYLKKYEYATPDGAGGYSFPLDNDYIRTFFHPGDTAYVKAAIYTRYVNGSAANGYLYDLGSSCFYVDPENGNYVYPSMSMSASFLKIPL